MTEIPALRDALVGAAARRVRRRRRQAATIFGWAAVATAVVLVLVRSDPRELERPAPPPAAVPAAQSFSAFRRPATAADALPAGALPGLDADSRRVLDEHGTRVWLAAVTHPKVEGFGGRRELCAVVRGTGGPGGFCITASGVTGLASPIRRSNAPDSVVFVLPDGARDPHATLSDGVVLSPAVHDNVALVVPREPEVVGASWTTPAGIRAIARWRDLDAKGWTPPEGCPKLGTLPAGAGKRAARAALLAVDRIYPSIQQAAVTRVSPVGPGLCTRDVTDRSLMVELNLTPFDVSQRSSASLTQGRLLAGMVDGRMTVWMIQH
jgi:hypothetical protein